MAHRGIIPLLTISLISIPCQAKSIKNTDVFTKSIRMPNVRPQKVSKSKCCRHELCKSTFQSLEPALITLDITLVAKGLFVLMERFLSFVPVDKSWEKLLYGSMIQKCVPFFILKKVLIQNLKYNIYLYVWSIVDTIMCTNAGEIRERKKNW